MNYTGACNVPACKKCDGKGETFYAHAPEHTYPYEWCFTCRGSGWIDEGDYFDETGFGPMYVPLSKEQPNFDTVLHDAQEALTHIGTGELHASNIVREGARTYEEGRLSGIQESVQDIENFHGMKKPLSRGEREPWHVIWMEVARTIARRSYGERLKVGAIIVPDDNTGILALGYNGLAKGEAHVPDSDQPGKDGFLHAELNAITKLDFNNPKKKHMYVTHMPCRMCARLCINANISRVVYGETYRDTSGLEILRAGNVEVLDVKEL